MHGPNKSSLSVLHQVARLYLWTIIVINNFSYYHFLKKLYRYFPNNIFNPKGQV